MKQIGIITSTRAEFGLLRPIIHNLRKHESDKFKVSLIVTGTHLIDDYGRTIDEIISSGVRVDVKIPVSMKSTSSLNMAENEADVVVKFTRFFEEADLSAIMILGDRYEMLMIAVAATNVGLPIFHISGGDTTEGAIDEAFRHSITKMSYYHFTSNEISRKRVIQLGEAPDRVFNVGSTSIDNITNVPLMSRQEALQSVGLGESCKYAICTYHPVTLEKQNVEKDVSDFVYALKRYKDIVFIVTKSNADKDGAVINELLDKMCDGVENIRVFSSLGMLRYLSLMKNAEFVLGNSSSGIIEAPAFQIPTINIGDRQRGRLQSESIINCGTSYNEISKAIERAISEDMKGIARQTESLYGDGHAAEKICRVVLEKLDSKIDIKKKFYDLQFDIRSEQ